MMDKSKNSRDTTWRSTSVMEILQDQINQERKITTIVNDIKEGAPMMKWSRRILMMILIEMEILCHCKSSMDG